MAAVLIALALSACGSSSKQSTAPSSTAAASAAASSAPSTSAGATTSGAPKVTKLADAPALIAAEAGVSNDQAKCIVDQMVSTAGAAKALVLVNDNRDLTELEPADRKVVGDALVTCVPKDQYAAIIAGTLMKDLDGSGITTDQAKCVGTKLVEAVTPDMPFGLASDALAFDKMTPEAQAKFISVFTACLSPEVLAKLANQPG
jgi:hypothetical protein